MEPVKAPAPLVIISSSPYIHCGSTISAAMRDVLLSLLPALARRCLLFRLAGAQRYPYLLPLGCHL